LYKLILELNLLDVVMNLSPLTLLYPYLRNLFYVPVVIYQEELYPQIVYLVHGERYGILLMDDVRLVLLQNI
jgi:hypothetical protein